MIAPTSSISVAPNIDKQAWQWRGHRIFYSVNGNSNNVPIVLVHGFGASIGHWRKNIPALAAAGYQVFAIDLLGFGAADKPELDYSLELWQELLQDFWQEKINQPAVFIGNSIGALLCLMVLADHPEMARAGVLLNSAGGLNHRPEELNPVFGLIMGTFTRLVSSRRLGQFIFNRVRQKQRIRGTLKQVYRNHEAISDELVEMLHQPSCDPGAQKVFASILTAPPGPKPDELLPKIDRPLLVLWGDRDPWTPISGATIYQQYSETKAIKFMPIANTGHCPHDERPELVNPLIVDWLSNI
ncbi:alpha/beta hydrolase fold protein [Thalassoporum mexicanum PCC 7367]|uniref:alpha/beta fold hydrolase n=1 Tax=Thalassoporum mexicanum TaxID=3457544 RepID=UPI00029FD4D5|nr:alpha/beta fold hydrolase [Pseudanabaena sp. PCC 7367]AFY71612.1 alpha/beta hydrolase fold protein [Pseudanabaena sp. PCC 7367]